MFKETSAKSINSVKFYPGVRRGLISLVKQGHKIGILTSKDIFRTKKIVKRLNIDFFDYYMSKQKKQRKT